MSSFYNMLKNLIENREVYEIMKNVAVEKGMSVFSYSKIAERSIQE